jgi:hypothetical protein
MTTGAIELKLIFSAGGAGGVAASIGSMTSRMDALTKSAVKSTDRMNAMGLSAVDSFAKEKAAVVAASRAVTEHQAATARMGKSLSDARKFQESSTAALKDYQQELSTLDAKPTEDQSLKLKLLREQAKGAEKDVKSLTTQFDEQRRQSKELNAGLTEQTRKVQALREEMRSTGINTAKLGEERVRLRRQMETEQRTLDKLTAKYQRLVAVQKDVTKYKAEFNDRKMNAVAAVGVGATLLAPVTVSAQFEDKIRQISITGELSGGAEVALANKVRAAAVKNGISQDSVASGTSILVAKGMNANEAGDYANMIAKTSKATRADMDDLANLIFTYKTQFKLSKDEIEKALNIQTKGGKLGQYELKAMAKTFPSLGNQAASFGSTGLDGIKETTAMMQIQRLGAGSDSEAETNMSNWFSHMSSNTVQNSFKSVGIDYEKAKLDKVIAGKGKVSNIEASFQVFDDYLNKVVESGQVKTYDKKGKLKSSTNIKAELDRAMEQAKKDHLQGEQLTQYMNAAVNRLGLSSVLQDMQATQAYLSYRMGKEKYHEIRKELDKKDVGKTIDRDWSEQDRLTTARWERLKTSMMDLSITIGNVLSPAVGSVLGGLSSVADKFNDLATKYPEAASVLVVVIGAIAAFTASLLALGAAASLARLGLASGRSIPILGRALGTPGVFGRAVSAVKSAGGGVLTRIRTIVTGATPPAPPRPPAPPSSGGFRAFSEAASRQPATSGWLSRLNPFGGIAKTVAPTVVSSAVPSASKMLFRPAAKVAPAAIPKVPPRFVTSSSSAIGSAASKAATPGWLSRLNPFSSVAKTVAPKVVPSAVPSASKMLFRPAAKVAPVAMPKVPPRVVTSSSSAIGSAASKAATPGWLSRLNPFTPVAKTVAPKLVPSAAPGASRMVFRPAAKVAPVALPKVSPSVVTSSSAAMTGGKAAATAGLLAKLSPVSRVVGKVATPLAVASALFSAGSALASTTMSRADKGSAVGGAAGSLAGGLAGAKLGALVGTMVFPGVGTVLGGLLGGVAGSLLGEKLGSHAGKTLAHPDAPKVTLPPIPQVPAKPAATEKKLAPIEIKLEYKPQVTIHGDPTPQTMQKFADMLRANQNVLESMLKRVLADQQRRAYQ